jgi:hypothetical protein
MFALGQKQTFAAQNVMSALPPESGHGHMRWEFSLRSGYSASLRDVRFTPHRT